MFLCQTGPWRKGALKLAGLNDKCQVCCNSDQRIVTTTAGLQRHDPCMFANFPDSWHITFTAYHCCNKETVKLYIERVIVPYFQRKKNALKLPSSQRALCIIDGFRVHCTSDVVNLLDHHNIDIEYVPANCTGKLQPLDLSVNKCIRSTMCTDGFTIKLIELAMQ